MGTLVLGLVGLVGWMCAAFVGGPLLLSRAHWPLRRPRVAIAAWLGLVGAGLLGLAAALGWAVIAAVRLTGADVADSVTTSMLAWTGLTAAGALASLVYVRVEAMRRSDDEADAVLLLLAASTLARRDAGGVTVVQVEAEAPVAVSMAGRGCIVVSSRLTRELTSDELAAVVAHESAHLSQRHGRVAQLARLSSACGPDVAGARWFARCAPLLLELAADDAAARRVGRPALTSALTKLGRLQADAGMLLRAARLAAHAA